MQTYLLLDWYIVSPSVCRSIKFSVRSYVQYVNTVVNSPPFLKPAKYHEICRLVSPHGWLVMMRIYRWNLGGGMFPHA